MNVIYSAPSFRNKNQRTGASLVKVIVLTLLLSLLSILSPSLVPESSAATVTATGTNPAICNQEVGNATNVVAYRLAGGDCVVEFKNVGTTTWTVSGGVTSVSALVIGGGGGGGFGSLGAGGGAGEVLISGTTTLSAGVVSGSSPVTAISGAVVEIRVGAGGTSGAPTGATALTANWASQSATATKGGNGGTSSFGTVAADGGGGGGGSNPNHNGQTGGSGGGSAMSGIGGGVDSSGLSGWTSYKNVGETVSGGYGGGGGAGSAGGLPATGRGGAGVSISITGTSVKYAGGGGGWGKLGSENILNDVSLGGNGRLTTGDWPYAGSSNNTSPGAANTGTGGGSGAPGGSGIVIIRYTPDTTAPTLSSTSVASNGTSLTLTYNETLSATTAATSRFTVSRTRFGWVTPETPTVSSASVSGSTVTLNLLATLFAGDTVTVSYSDPSGSDDANAVQDVAGNDAASLTNQAVTNTSTAKQNQSALSITQSTLVYGETLTLTTSGGLGSGAVTYTENSAACSISGTTLTGDAVGNCIVTATKATDTNYLETTTTKTITVTQASQSTLTITSTTIPYGQSLSLTTSGGSGTGLLSFVVNTGNCSITNATLTATSTGSCSVTATKASDTNYLAESTTATITITTGSATATIAFSSTTLTFGIANPITVTISTAGTVRFSANGRVIKNCKSISTITSGTITATCSYRPATRRPLTIQARLAPTDLNIAPRTSTSAEFLVQRRTTR